MVDRNIERRRELVPTDILLAVEIAGSTLSFDIGRKRVDYATAGIRNYWVVDLAGGRVHCYADPQGLEYASIQIVGFGEPLCPPGSSATITVA